jgi:hypothetical protein
MRGPPAKPSARVQERRQIGSTAIGVARSPLAHQLLDEKPAEKATARRRDLRLTPTRSRNLPPRFVAWMKSIVTGSLRVANALRATGGAYEYRPQPWDTELLTFAVREPFPSKSSSAELVYGTVTAKQPLKLRSRMPENGVIFSDGMETDYLRFTAGLEATIAVSERPGRLVI